MVVAVCDGAHHCVQMYRDEEDQQGQKLMDEKIVEKQQHAQEGLQEVARQRRQLSKDMRQAMDLVVSSASSTAHHQVDSQKVNS